ncbi:MAG: Hsp20/alpha crystallin family protein [Burkholderiaceae bacterium]|nr:Hsp20/alpha crystallin family protein [Burkholderiaceae bacterium]
MNALTRFDRDDFFPEMMRRFFRTAPWYEDGAGDIRIDVTENDKSYEVTAAVPGVKREDIQVAVDGNLVSISTETRSEREKSEGGRVLLKESHVGRASRSFTLGKEVDADKVKAKLEDGVLKLTLPKREGASSRRIEIA